jgi:uncharacterized membrane protein
LSPEELLSLGIPKVLVVIITAALPILELRGAIPVAMTLFQFPWYYAFLLAMIGNMLPVPVILLFLDKITLWLNKIGFCRRFLDWLFERTRRQSGVVGKYERIGLALFVAIPLPVTGAWTGSLLAVLMGIRFKQAFLSIFIGVLIAGIIITCLSLLGLTIYGMWRG